MAALFALGAAAVTVVALGAGDYPVPVGDVVAALFGGGSDDAAFVVRTLRLPRAVAALLVGAALGLSGAVLQALTRNPLASPDIAGVTAGAAMVAVVLIVALHAPAVVVTAGAFAGALVVAIVIAALTGRDLSSPRLVLTGLGVGAWSMAVTSYVLTRAPALDAPRAVAWLTGSVAGATWHGLVPVTVTLAVGAAALVPLAAALSALQLGDDVARGLGVDLERARRRLLVVGVALAAAATATAGPVAFVAFVAPAIARRCTRSSTALAASACAGALLVAAADLAARRAFAPVELPAGAVSGVIGAPYLLVLMIRSGRIGRAG